MGASAGETAPVRSLSSSELCIASVMLRPFSVQSSWSVTPTLSTLRVRWNCPKAGSDIRGAAETLARGFGASAGGRDYQAQVAGGHCLGRTRARQCSLAAVPEPDSRNEATRVTRGMLCCTSQTWLCFLDR